MSAVETQFTIADLERMPDDGIHREILNGVLIELPPPKLRHSLDAIRITRSLLRSVEAGSPLTVLVEAGYRVQGHDRMWLQPDVSVIATARLEETDSDGYVLGAPEVAIEVISRSESFDDVFEKTEAYLKAGAKAVVNVHPKQRVVKVHTADKEWTLRGEDTLSLPDVIPGWSMKLAEIFG